MILVGASGNLGLTYDPAVTRECDRFRPLAMPLQSGTPLGPYTQYSKQSVWAVWVRFTEHRTRGLVETSLLKFCQPRLRATGKTKED